MSRPRYGTPAIRVASTAAAVLLLTAGCGTSRQPVRPTAAPPRSEGELRRQAEALLTRSSEVRLHWTGAVEKRQRLGRTTPRLPAGKYVLEAACAGTGAVELYWNTKEVDNDAEPEVRCGGGVARSYFNGENLVAFAFEPSDIYPPSGFLSWQIVSS
ncbi:hypothetical protein RVR_5574 [Actinacidiphila reveromycinica]|uniref:Lipoprotein n=1 Tax=Actinacidiphila reveromycinica TaxID=659352 RepID=A0A7U3UUK0_9ACTN|nr:hypothetical protein [Streptomyces sp. SN-593]BBA99097.1 hypothetical protein RVR_5574 [Streptomyces sp. SN-593]